MKKNINKQVFEMAMKSLIDEFDKINEVSI